MNRPIVQLQNVHKSFGPFKALNDINLDIRQGEILTLLGPSGCGKTTLMRIIAGFEAPTSGSLLIAGNDAVALPPEKRSVNMVFQRYALFPHLDVFDNVAFGLRLQGVSKTQIKEQVNAMLHLVQLDSFANRWINELSGGQCQRVALARALVNRPDVLLLDEPLAALDLKIRHHMLKELKRIHEETGTTFVYVTHDQDEAMILSDRVVLMNKGEIEQLGSPQDLYAAPESLFCARFFGDTNIVEGQVGGVSDGLADISTAFFSARGAVRRASTGASVSLSIRPEAIRLDAAASDDTSPSHNAITGDIEDVMFIGNRVVYQVKHGDSLFTCQQARPVAGIEHAPGSRVRLSWPDEAVVVLTH
ncbi:MULTISPECIES: ABC transporter ATP-binding protein [Pseudomonas]|uniref:ABC transporter ATP-binding protein n=1 Tax=Pseudomonas TaxID=286 RepID=UPI0023638B97|nr:ABC transporter ATP-binding protein [Pseudomonas putida]MDD2146779.1 ABC transporter ATP-binding protein [Pseudomonas putida]HDS1705572.1 ABC transporter ATP-binding protein [Pseudomonas putida]